MTVEAGKIRLVQVWSLPRGSGIRRKANGLILLAGRDYFIPPHRWKRCWLCYKIISSGSAQITSCFGRENCISGVTVTLNGVIKIDIYNTSSSVVRVTPNTPFVAITGYASVEIERLPDQKQVNVIQNVDLELEQEIRQQFPDVGDLSTHPITLSMSKLEVKEWEVRWSRPPDSGYRTPYSIIKGACRHKVLTQIETYIKRGYIREASVSETLFLSPLLPVEKSDGTYRLVNDYRLLNAYFDSGGTEQPSVWQKLWGVKSSWRYFVKIDLKDAFFSVPICEGLQRMFGFTWFHRRFTWTRIPQGFLWSPVLFSERISEVLRNVDVIQYMDDLLIGSHEMSSLRRKTRKVFARLSEFGLKANFTKTVFGTTSVSFLGVEIKDGMWSLKKYLANKVSSFGCIEKWKDLERLIGVLSYVRQTVPHLESIIAPLREKYQTAKKKPRSTEWWEETRSVVQQVISRVFDRQIYLSLPGISPTHFRIESDWSGHHSGYLLYAVTNQETHLVDLGSKTLSEPTSSFLGEFKSIIWACKSTKAYRGSHHTILVSDNISVVQQLQSGFPSCSDKRVLRLWGWLCANEDFSTVFVPGNQNVGADLLSRPRMSQKSEEEEIFQLTSDQLQRIKQAHLGHWGWKRTMENLRQSSQPLWRNAVRDVKKYVDSCPRCQVYGPMPQSPPWKSISCDVLNSNLFIDYLGPLQWDPDSVPVYIFVVIDGLSRYAQLSVTRGPTARASIRSLRQWIDTVGVPHRIICDQAAAFTSHTFAQFCVDYHVDLLFISAGAHWSAGIVERCIGTILNRIRRNGPVRRWESAIANIGRIYNQSVHSAISANPKTVMFGIDITGRELSPAEHSEVIRRAVETTKTQQLKRNQRHEASRPQRPEIVVGDKVLLRKISFNKLEEPWQGPYYVDRAHGSRMYWLRNHQNQVSGPWHAHQLKVLPNEDE